MIKRRIYDKIHSRKELNEERENEQNMKISVLKYKESDSWKELKKY
jgi:hypothetical protein